MEKEEKSVTGFDNSKICFFSNYPPKKCGIATFTRDLVEAMDKRFNPKLKSEVAALNDSENFYNYPKKVIIELDKEDIEDYIQSAKRINENPEIKIVCVQHEFGIFGGKEGSYLIPFLETLKKPVVVTFHSIPPEPDKMKKKIVRAIFSRASAIIVMADKAIEILKNDYEVPKKKIYVIPHGIPSVEYTEDNTAIKERLNLRDKIVLCTFGLLSKGKGIEYMIKALPPLVKKYPQLVYLVIGETHPVVRMREGEKYRNYLMNLVKKLDLKEYVKFYNKFVDLPELLDYLAASDIYICTNIEKKQITSGTLSYAMGCGKAVISTPILHAEELLAHDRGMIVQLKKPKSYTKAIEKILSDAEFKKNLERYAYAYSRAMTWPNVAYNYLRVFNKIKKLREEITEKFPEIKLSHLQNLTDDFGIIQFSKHSIPDKSTGYTSDDNARALIFSSLHNRLFNDEPSLNLSRIYLRFLEMAQKEDGSFKNNHRNQEEITEKYSDDAFGRVIWALGYTINKSGNQELKSKSLQIFNRALKNIRNLQSLRAKAFTLIGLSHYYENNKDARIASTIKKLADELVESYTEESSKGWEWFESSLTYSNSKLPEALFYAYKAVNNEKYLEVAQKSLGFLSDLVFIDGELSPIGQNGWYRRNGERAFFDQQPVEVSSIVQAYLTAYKITKDKDYYNKAIIAFNWFMGKNHLKQMLYDETTGGCHDGLGAHTLNMNQGAESTLSYLMARLFLEEAKMSKL